MDVTTEPPPDSSEPLLSFWQRLGWFGGLALAAVLAAAGVAGLLKALLG